MTRQISRGGGLRSYRGGDRVGRHRTNLTLAYTKGQRKRPPARVNAGLEPEQKTDQSIASSSQQADSQSALKELERPVQVEVFRETKLERQTEEPRLIRDGTPNDIFFPKNEDTETATNSGLYDIKPNVNELCASCDILRHIVLLYEDRDMHQIKAIQSCNYIRQNEPFITASRVGKMPYREACQVLSRLVEQQRFREQNELMMVNQRNEEIAALKQQLTSSGRR